MDKEKNSTSSTDKRHYWNKSPFVIYNEEFVTLEGDIKCGCLHLESNVYGEDYDSEKHYTFSEEDTEKLFSIMSLDEFIEACRKGHLMWLEDFLEENDIHPGTCCF